MYRLLDFSQVLLSRSGNSLCAAMSTSHPYILGRRLWTRFTFLGSGHQREAEKLHSGLDPVARKCTTGFAFLLREIKYHIKTRYILGRKDKNTKRACLIFGNAILSFVSSGIQLARLPSLFNSWRLSPTSYFAISRVCFHECAWACVHVLHSIHTHQWAAAAETQSTAGGLINCTEDSAHSTGAIPPGAARQQRLIRREGYFWGEKGHPHQVRRKINMTKRKLLQKKPNHQKKKLARTTPVRN